MMSTVSANANPIVRPGASDRSVMVIDDDPAIRDLLTAGLSPYFRLWVASDNLEAWNLLQSIPAPSVLVVDVMTPLLDGFAFARRVKQHPSLKSVPIIFLTAKAGALDLVEGINSGAKHYLTKPFKLSSLLEKLATLTGVSIGPSPTTTGRPPATPSGRPPGKR